MIDYLQKNVDISHLSNFKTKAFAKYYYEINSEQDTEKLKDIYLFSKINNIGMLIIGSGTNILFAFETYDGIVINNNLLGWNYNSESKILTSNSGEIISDIAKDIEKNYNNDIWHRFIGLPGTLGGAVYGNAGCFGLETQNNFTNARVYNLKTGKIETISEKDMKFGYRSSLLKETNMYFLIGAEFDLSEKKEKYSSEVDNIYFRETKQPKGNTCGSFFKNPSKEFPAGKLIEEVGLKGYKLGGAFFSPKHANFLINDGSGDYNDLLKLISLTQKKVKKQFNINLIPEVKIIYNIK